jgi:multidrug resistance efflux pump
MSERLIQGLATTRRELEIGLADAEAELAGIEANCRRLEALIAVGRATLHSASHMNLQPRHADAGVAQPSSRAVKPSEPSLSTVQTSPAKDKK